MAPPEYTSIRLTVDTKAELDKLKFRLSDHTPSYDKLIRFLLSDEYSILNKIKQDLSNEYDEITKQIEQLQKRASDIKERIQKIDEKIKNLEQSEINRLRNENNQLRGRVAELEEKVNTLSKKCEEYEKVLSESIMIDRAKIREILYDFYSILHAYFIVKYHIIDKNSVLSLDTPQLMNKLLVSGGAMDVINLLRKEYEKLEQKDVTDLVKELTDKYMKQLKLKRIQEKS